MRSDLLTLFLVTAQTLAALAQNFTGTTGSGEPILNRQPSLVMRYMICIEGGVFPDDVDSTPTQSMPPDRDIPFLGEIKAVPFNYDTPPRSWAYCEGQHLPINQNQALFSLLGTRYGGNGVTTFALPDLRGRVPIGAGTRPGDPPLGSVVGVNTINLAAPNLPAHTHSVAGGDTGATGHGRPMDNRQESLALRFLIAANGEIMIVPWPYRQTGWTACDGRLLDSATHTYLYSHIGTVYGGSGAEFALPDLRGRVVIGDDGPGSAWPIGRVHGNPNLILELSNLPAHTHSIPGGSTGLNGGGVPANNYQPSLVMRWMISPYGVFPTPGGGVSFPMVSEMRLIAGSSATGITNAGWLHVDGQLLPINEYEPLYYVIGTTYGGDNEATFALPNLINRAAIARSTGLMVGNYIGSETLLISVAQLAAHAHTVVPFGITAVQHFADGSVNLTLRGPVGTTCQLDKSGNLATWSNLGAVEFTTPTRTISDPNPGNAAKQFYHAHFP